MNKRNRANDDSPRKRNRISDNPRKLPYQLIKLITNNFSEERVLGCGASGEVFKGVLEDGEEVAVKMLRCMGNINDQQFENEFEILKQLEHPNIVRLVAFCNEAQEVCIEYNGKLTVCQRIHRALCLEYMPNGSLRKLLSGENLGNNWPMRYKIIKGICKGLEYLREGLEFPIFHFDLKPDNILLNEEMMPKISDFGLSRLIGDENSKKTLTPLGTIGYLPPEFIDYQVISKEYDIYSLGVIITQTITGITGYSDVADMGAEEFVEHVHENWKKRLQGIPRYGSLEVDCRQVKRCIEIARRCIENDRRKRPTIKDIVNQLDDVEMENCIVDLSLQLGEIQTIVPVASEDLEVDEGHECHTGSKEFSIGKNPTRLHKSSLEENDDVPWHRDPARPVVMMDAGAPYLCYACKEPGYGARYLYDCGGVQSHLHTRCTHAEDPLFDLNTLVHPLFGYGKQFEFRFRHEARLGKHTSIFGGKEICDACGEPTRGCVYQCDAQDLLLHPCCASLPDRFLQDGCAFDLHRRASRPCALCPDDEGQRRWFWAYRGYVDGEAIDLHVACLKQTARRSWEVEYHNQDACDGALNVDSMLENMFTSIGFEKFGEIAASVAGFITALVFGKLNVNM